MPVALSTDTVWGLAISKRGLSFRLEAFLCVVVRTITAFNYCPPRSLKEAGGLYPRCSTAFLRSSARALNWPYIWQGANDAGLHFA